MPDTITAGKILMREGTELPEAVRLESEPYAAGWRLIKNLSGDGLSRKIHDAGWTFFCQAGDLNAISFGIDGQEMVRRSVQRILAKVKPEKFNCLEITRIAEHRFLGVPYVSVSARLRHIQESVFLFQTDDLPVRERARLAAAA
jgi:hypothetical protein